MNELLEFTSEVWMLYYSRLGLFSKIVVLSFISYFGLSAIKQIVKFLFIVIFKITKRRNDPADVEKYDPDKIYLHMFFRRITKQVPNLSPFAIKLETWFRLKGIQYETVETRSMSNATRQIPYVNYKGKEITDSDLIIEYMEKEFSLDQSEGLQAKDLAISRAFIRMLDEATCWTYFIHRYCYQYKDFTKIFGTPFENKLGRIMFNKVFPKGVKRTAEARGIGRKSASEVYHIGQEDIRALSTFLGEKPFMMGDSMTKVDCAVFGHLSQIVFVDFHYPHKDFIDEECPNLLPYMERIKTKYWPDWDTIVPQGHFP